MPSFLTPDFGLLFWMLIAFLENHLQADGSVTIPEVLRHAGPKHVMFGTDMPILRMRCRRIAENGNYVNPEYYVNQ